ncbi:19295_t:CDS:2 [Dentiscutata erythropus]|uniref:19295_t:CDS:1 n=1 Tax=Dentiscutata erythropus TaxID=1348616 RepID=A0A9N8VFT7_9GLOM|nr:19295_t:CDS:2 [Dentiscutata erythropus]
MNSTVEATAEILALYFPIPNDVKSISPNELADIPQKDPPPKDGVVKLYLTLSKSFLEYIAS